MALRFVRFLNVLLLALSPVLLLAQLTEDTASTDVASLTADTNKAADLQHLTPVPELKGVEFVKESNSQIVLEKDGKRYLIDTATRQIQEIPPRIPEQPNWHRDRLDRPLPRQRTPIALQLPRKSSRRMRMFIIPRISFSGLFPRPTILTNTRYILILPIALPTTLLLSGRPDCLTCLGWMVSRFPHLA